MQSSEQVVNRILDLDRQAESIRDQAREEAESIRRDSARHIAEEKDRLEKRIIERISQIEAESIQARGRGIAEVNKGFDGQVKEMSEISREKIAGVVDMVVTRIRERAS